MSGITATYFVDYEFDTEESGNPPPWISLMDFAQEIVNYGLQYGISEPGAITVVMHDGTTQQFDYIGFHSKYSYTDIGRDDSMDVTREVELYMGSNDTDLRWSFESRITHTISGDAVRAFFAEDGGRPEKYEGVGKFANWFLAQEEDFNRFITGRFMVGYTKGGKRYASSVVSLTGDRLVDDDIVPEATNTSFQDLTAIRRGVSYGGIQGISRDAKKIIVSFDDRQVYVKPARTSKRPASALESASGSGAGAGTERGAARARTSEDDRSVTAYYDDASIRALLVHHEGDVEAVAQALMAAGVLDRTKQIGQKIKGAISRKPASRSIAAIQADLDNTQIILQQFLKDPKRDQNPTYQEQVRRLGQLRTELATAKAKSASGMYGLEYSWY